MQTLSCGRALRRLADQGTNLNLWSEAKEGRKNKPSHKIIFTQSLTFCLTPVPPAGTGGQSRVRAQRRAVHIPPDTGFAVPSQGWQSWSKPALVGPWKARRRNHAHKHPKQSLPTRHQTTPAHLLPHCDPTVGSVAIMCPSTNPPHREKGPSLTSSSAGRTQPALPCRSPSPAHQDGPGPAQL